MMNQYKFEKDFKGNDCAITIVGQNISIPMNPDNTDYANFKKQILADEAQLQDADGKTMTANKAKEFVATLP
jgi:hypothetical protein